MAHLNSLVGMGNFGPTQQAIEVKNEIVAQIDMRLAKYEQLKQVELKAFNRLLIEREVEVIRVD
ncbi:MAG: hypothetical protein R3A43_06435 [Bacteroidia bacterium]